MKTLGKWKVRSWDYILIDAGNAVVLGKRLNENQCSYFCLVYIVL